jgi:single-strand DNA-binding protein
MAGVNKVILLGNLGKDPEIQNFESGVKKAAFSLATTEVYKNKEGNKIEQTEWHNIVLWRDLAEVAEKYLKKGAQIYIEGKIRTRSWEDKENNKRYVTEIIGDNMTMLRTKKETPHDNSPIESNSNDTIVTAPDDDLPF